MWNLRLFPVVFVLFTLHYVDCYGINAIISRFDAVVRGIENLLPLQTPTTPVKLPNQKHVIGEKFDFIIVGSGSGGAVLANRLSEISQFKVLLLEAGRQPNILNRIPLLAPLYQLTGFNWNYTMAKQDGICLGMYDEKCSWPRGKALGGSTILNYMIYTRGNPQDYQKWSMAVGNPEWDYDHVLPYFLKSEDCNLRSDVCEKKEFHKTGGLLSIEHPFKSELSDAFIQAGVELGYDHVLDYNSKDFMGFSQIQGTQKHGKRHSSYDAFLKPIQHRRNLKTVISARVTKILIDGVTKKALGVQFRKRGRTFQVFAEKEVILSAGTFNTPQLLMLSGVGPKDHLRKFNITSIQDLPVGRTLYDHLGYPGLAFTINQTIEPREVIFDPTEFITWLKNGHGPFTSLAGIEAIAYVNTASITDRTYPDIELLFAGVGSLEADFGQVVAKELRIRRDIYDRVYKPIEFVPAWSIIPMLLHPKSRGYMELRSRNPYDPPLLYGNFFKDTKDLETMLAAIRFIIKLSETPAFQKYNSKLHDTPIPGCHGYKFNSDDYWRCALRHLSVTLHHQVGTCRMGSKSDREAVVDSRLRVIGVKNLRIVDASVMPVTISAHSSGPAMMIGEKAGDFIKQDWGIDA